MLPTDADLTHSEIDLTSGEARVLLLACGALAREILDIIEINALAHLHLRCLPAIYHNTPEKIVPAIRDIIARDGDTSDKVFVVYADCGTGGQLQAACDELGVEMVKGPHCYSFFEGNDAFAKRDEITSFYLTDFLVRQFDAFVWKPLGLDRHPDLRDMYFSHYTTLVYQSQIHDPALVALAQQHADRLGLSFEHRHTGYGDLETTLLNV